MSWFSEYYVSSEVDSTVIEKFKEFLIKEDENINLLEEEYNNSLEKINNLSDKEDIESFFKSENSLFLLETQLEIIKLLSKYTLQNNYLNYEFFVKCINLLIKSSTVLSERLKQPEISHKSKVVTNYLPRCSYKFCNFKNECFYNYNVKTKNVCYQDHYVHNMVLADLIILLDYINLKFSQNNLVVPNKEILKTINTLSFVIEHMYSELKSRCLYLKENEYEKEHFVKRNN